ncbi:vacuole morphology and inheritance protein 14 [Diutina catenulata]
MGESRVLDSAIVKDLSNHIYEKRKATAFQIESFTKAALSRNDSQTIYRIIAELAELTNSGTNSAKMGAITALGSVSVALGSIAIAYFLEEIIKPIFATFKDTDARVRYYACESLYNIAKIARGEILVYFNEVFDILSILVTDSESSVKNAADILDRLIKDIVSAKATNYVSILHQNEPATDIKSHLVDADGVAIQINHPQDTEKAFSLPKFIPTLLERMYVLDPYSKKFMLSWLELFDDIPTLELVSFLPNFLEPLIKFMMNSAPADVRMETENVLNMFLHEVQAISRAKLDKRRRHRDLAQAKEAKEAKAAEKKSKDDVSSRDSADDTAGDTSVASIASTSTTVIRPQTEASDDDDDDTSFVAGQDIYLDYAAMIEILLPFLPFANSKRTAVDTSGEPHEITVVIQQTALTWLQSILAISPSGFVNLLPTCIEIVVKNIAATEHDKDYELRNQYLELNEGLEQVVVQMKECSPESQLQGVTPELYSHFVDTQLAGLVAAVVNDYGITSNDRSKITCLQWLSFLFEKTQSAFIEVIKAHPFSLADILKPASNDVTTKVLELFSEMTADSPEMFVSLVGDLLGFFQLNYQQNKPRIEFIVRRFCVSVPAPKVYHAFAKQLDVATHPELDLDFAAAITALLNNILLTSQELVGLRKKLRGLDIYKVDDWATFSVLFRSWCHSPTSALSLCLLTSNYELAYLIIKYVAEQEVTYTMLVSLDILVQLIESPIFLKLRMQLLEPDKHPYLYKTLYGLLMILPQSSTYTTLQNRLTSVATLHQMGSSQAPAPPIISSNPPTPGATATSPANQLSLRKKHNYEMLDIFVKVQELHEAWESSKPAKAPPRPVEETKEKKIGYK